MIFRIPVRQMLATLQIPTPDTVQSPAAGPGAPGFLAAYPLVETAVWVVGIVLLAWLANTLTRRYLLRIISRVVTQTKSTWDDVIFKRKVFRRLAHVAPAVGRVLRSPLVPGVPPRML